MTRLIERWFPCKEVSENSTAGWGSGNTERSVFTWFAARPTAQAKAAVICSLLPWPKEEAEQRRLQDLVKLAMSGRYAAWEELRAQILAANPAGASVLDPFSGRGMIPLEAARLGLESHALEYAPVAVLASHLLTDYPFRDWTGEPELPFAANMAAAHVLDFKGNEAPADRYYRDVEGVLREVGRRHAEAMADFYPAVDGKQPWGYLWAVTLPCQECGRRFPLVGSYNLRLPSVKRATRMRAQHDDPGQSYYIATDPATGTFNAVVHDGPPRKTPTLANAIVGGKSARGKTSVCPFCGYSHPLETHKRLTQEGHGRDALLVVADQDESVGKLFRTPRSEELDAARSAVEALGRERGFSPLLPAIPDEEIPLNSGATIRPQLYGARTYGDLMISRQTLSFVRLARVVNTLTLELRAVGVSDEYVRALTANAGAVLVRKIMRSTRGTSLDVQRQGTNNIFKNESTISFSHDSLETGIGDGAGTWNSISTNEIAALRNLCEDLRGRPASVTHGSAVRLSHPPAAFSAVVTDPPYDAMVYYSDSSDLMYAWLKRALFASWPELAVTPDGRGLQDKAEEIIVMDHNKTPGEHRTRGHYDRLISEAFAEMRRVVRDDGVVTIVFGHGDPEVWQRLLGAITGAGLVLTGSWPANTESGGQQGKANIKTTLTMPCRPAAANRPEGRKAQVEAEVKAEVAARIDMWEASGLAPTDMLMSSAGPAMEVVGRYSQVLDITGERVDPADYLVVARRAVRENAKVEIDHQPLDTFDARTRFALWWVKLFGKTETAKSELRWQTLADDLELTGVRDLVPDASKGVMFTGARKTHFHITPESPVIDVALTMAKAWPEGADAVGQVLAAADKDTDPYLWAAITFLADRLPDSDADAIAWTKIVRNRAAVSGAAKGAHAAAADQKATSLQDVLDFIPEA